MSDRLLEQFLGACGADGPLRLDVALGDDPTEHRSLPRPFAVLGRGPDVDLRVDHHLISRRHAYLQVIAGRVFCIDLGSRTGTRWGDGSDRAGWLHGGQILQVGPALIGPGDGTWGWHRTTTERVTDDPSPLASRDPEHDPLPAVTLEFPRNSRADRVFHFDRVLVLAGRSPECKLRLGDPEVSNLHCSLLRTPGGVWVIDLLGRGGILVNGARVRYARLDDGDRLQVGRHVIRLRYGAHDGHQDALPGPRPGSSRAVALAGRHPASPGLDRSLAGRPADQVELVGALLGPLLGEFGALQQQMAEMQQKRADEFQQALMTMFQMFGAMHRDQMNLIREEMDQINRLAQEQRAMESELAKHESARTNGPGPAPARSEVLRPENEPAFRKPDRASPVASAAGDGPDSGRRADSGRIETPARPPDADRRPPASPADGEDIHLWLHRRITNIQQERQGRWQKILSSVMGQKPGEPLP